jgi:hypothetical protein
MFTTHNADVSPQSERSVFYEHKTEQREKEIIYTGGRWRRGRITLGASDFLSSSGVETKIKSMEN